MSETLWAATAYVGQNDTEGYTSKGFDSKEQAVEILGRMLAIRDTDGEPFTHGEVWPYEVRQEKVWNEPDIVWNNGDVEDDDDD